MWSFQNPVKIIFGTGELNNISQEIRGRPYCLVTYNEPYFNEIATQISKVAGPAAIIINDIQPNPDFDHLVASCETYGKCNQRPEVIVAVGGGSVMDAAKVIACSHGDFNDVKEYLIGNIGEDAMDPTPIIAVPTTAGTGSEVTCWGTVWHASAGKKYSLLHPKLYAESAIVDPLLMAGIPKGLTIQTGLDALSHALESIWNVNHNPVSAGFAISASREILDVLPQLAEDLGNIELRSRMSKAALMAGMAFSNTKTALAHNISYPITIRYGVPHGLACSFTLPKVLQSAIGVEAECDDALKQIFGDDLSQGVLKLRSILRQLNVSTNHEDYGLNHEEWTEVVDLAFAGERGKNFIGARTSFQLTA